jgi:hypothetical protein
VTRVAVLRDATTPQGIGLFAVIRGHWALGLELRPIGLRDADEIERGAANQALTATVASTIQMMPESVNVVTPTKCPEDRRIEFRISTSATSSSTKAIFTVMVSTLPLVSPALPRAKPRDFASIAGLWTRVAIKQRRHQRRAALMGIAHGIPTLMC